jgi:hypothetical protein
MADETPPSSKAVERGHEFKDVSARAIVWTGITVVATMVVSAMIVYVWIDLSGPDDQWIPVSKRYPNQMPGRQPPASSGLPGTSIDDPEVLTARKEALLHRYRWVDKGAKIVSMPIERAMRKIADKGLPDFDQRDVKREQQ